MGSMSWLHWLVLLAVLAIFFIPVARIFKRAGWSPWLTLVVLIPGASIVLLWVFAFAPWPAVDGAKPSITD